MIRKARALYSPAWLARYGRGLTPDEVRLVQAYRGVAALPSLQQDLLSFAAWLVLDRDSAMAAARVLRAAEGAKPYHWKCDDPSVTNGGGR